MQYVAVRTRAHNNGVVEKVIGPFNTFKEATEWANRNAIHNADLDCNDWQVMSLNFQHYAVA